MPNKANPKCIYCSSQTKKIGFKKNKFRTAQRYLCNTCKKTFIIQPNLQKYKTYDLKTILNTITNLNLGYSLKQTRSYYKTPRSTLSYWYNMLKKDLPYHRIRPTIRKYYKQTDIIKTKRFIHHRQPFLYQYHKPKTDLFLKHNKKLKHYLENLPKLLPKNFSNSKRISQLAKNPTTWRDEASILPSRPKAVEANVVVGFSKKQNYATKLAKIATQITKNNKERHNIIENFMLKNDTTTIATEVPVFFKQKSQLITGHIDILQIRYNNIYILDYKPEPFNKQHTVNQLLLYKKALKNITNNIKVAFFNDKGYYEVKH